MKGAQPLGGEAILCGGECARFCSNGQSCNNFL